MVDVLLSEKTEKRLQNLLAGCPEKIPPEGLVQSIRNATNVSTRYEAILATLAQLKAHDGSRLLEDDGAAARELAECIALHLLVVQKDEADMETQALAAEAALASLCVLAESLHLSGSSLSDAVLLPITTYTNASDTWTTTQASTTARTLLKTQLAGDKLSHFIAGPLLHDYFRSLFSRTSSSRITSSGRPAYYRETGRGVPHTPLTHSVWKDGAREGEGIIMSRFQWTVESSDEALLVSKWPLFTPPLLALIEDDHSTVRRRGLEIMAIFLDKCPTEVLESSGMRNVIEDAIFPTLMFLPSLTPEAESAELLHAAYRALLLLTRRSPGRSDSNRRQLLNRIFREGIEAAYFHASQHARIVEVLMTYTALIVQGLGIHATKHLSVLISIFTSILQDPFAMVYPPAVLKTVQALNATLANCWTRTSIPTHAEQIINVVTTCWLNLHDADTSSQGWGHDRTRVDEQLKIAAACIQATWLQANSSPPQKMATVVRHEPRVADLFPDFSPATAESA